MVLSTFLVALLALALSTAHACGNHDKSSPSFAIGNDGPADPATLGYTLNHFALLTHNITAVKHFYGEILGMRTVFSFGANTPFEVLYMGYSHGGKNGTGYQTGEQLYSEKNNIEGLLEFLYVEDCKDSTAFIPTTVRPSSFSHIGLIVPDLEATQGRMQAYGVSILKRIGLPIEPGSPAALVFGYASNTAAARAALMGAQTLGFDSFLLVTDPDGNLLEIQQQVSDVV